MRPSLPVAAAVVLLALACSDVSRLRAGECGDTVVEPGEDCDVHAELSLGDGLECGAPGDARTQCRYLCSRGGAKCPRGWACGSGGVCVHGTEQLVDAPGSPFDLPSDSWVTGDVDGDGRMDVVTTHAGDVRVLFGAADASLRDGFARRSSVRVTGALVMNDLDGEGGGDVLVPTALGVEVLRGDADRVLVPVAHAPYTVEGLESARLVPIRAVGSSSSDSLLLVASDAGRLHLRVVPLPDPRVFPVLAVDEPRSVASLADSLAVADLDGDGSDEVTLTWPSAASVRVFETIAEPDGRASVRLRAEFALPGKSSGRVFIVDVDGDGARDLVAPLEGGMIAVAHGSASAAFASFALDERFAALGPDLEVLAARDLNGDRVADWVTSRGVFVADANGYALLETWSAPGSARYRAAQIDDLSGDGVPDIVAVSDEPSAVHVLLGDGAGRFTDRVFPTAGAPFALRTGDFDGDRIADVVFGVRGAETTPDDVWQIFGEAAGGPKDPLRLARFPRIEHIEVGTFRDGEGRTDAANDVVVSLAPERPTVRPLAFFAGSPWRSMSSPLALRQASSQPAAGTVPIAVASGQFHGGARDPSWAALVESFDGLVLWTVPAIARASYRVESARASPLASLAGAPRRRPDAWTAGDIDGDGTDELLWLAGDADRLEAHVLRWSPSGHVTFERLSLEGSGRPLRSSMVDFDRDGTVELLVTFERGVALYPRSLDGRFGTPIALDAEDAAPVDVDGDASRELVLLRGGRVVIADVSLAQRSVVERAPPTKALPGARRVLAADIDGDGIDDVLATDGRRVWVHRVVPHFQGGTRQ